MQDDDNDYDDHSPMFWEEYAEEKIRRLIEFAEFDDVRGVVTLPSRDDTVRWGGVDCESLESLEHELIEAYNEQWYAYVPFDGGPVFEDDAQGAVSNLLIDHPKFNRFFSRQRKPKNATALVTAQELLLNAGASHAIRLSVDEVNEELVRYLAANPSKMRELSPRKFEELIADMFRNQGYEVTLTPSSKDGGMDVIAVQRDGIGTVMIIVECKRYAETNKVGVEIARGLYGVVEQRRATRGIIATTSFFTKGAVEFRNTVEHRLGLADFDFLSKEIVKWKNRIQK